MGVQSAPIPWIWRGSQGPTYTRIMERQHLVLAVASFLVALAWIPNRAEATEGLKLGVASHPALQERAEEMMAMIRMVDVADRDLITWIPQFKSSWKAYTAKTTKEPKIWYCKKWEELNTDLNNLHKQIALVRAGISAKRTQLQAIRDILSDPKLNQHSGLDCNKDSKEAICEILDNLDLKNNEDETELNGDENEIKAEENTVATYTCDCTMGPWSEWGVCVPKKGDCGPGIHKKTRVIEWNKRNEGNECEEKEEEAECEDKCCPVDCEYSTWSDWTPCPELCDGKKHMVERERRRTVPMVCKGQTCEDKYPEGKEQMQECNILQVKAKKVAEWEEKIAGLEAQLATLKGKFCSPNPCENNTPCSTGETTDEKTGLKHPVAQCDCGTKFTGDRCEQEA